MIAAADNRQREAVALNRILDLTRKLAAPFDLDAMLKEVVDATRNILDADRGTVFSCDEAADELFIKVTIGMETICIPTDKGIVGESAKTRRLINVPDCYADERFEGPIVANLLRYLRLHVELALRAKGLLVMRESGVDIAADEKTRAKLATMKFLEASIGKTGKLALKPFFADEPQGSVAISRAG